MRKDYNKLCQSYSELETKKNKIEDDYQRLEQKYHRLEVYYETLINKLKKENLILKQKTYDFEKKWGNENVNQMNFQKNKKFSEISQ